VALVQLMELILLQVLSQGDVKGQEEQKWEGVLCCERGWGRQSSQSVFFSPAYCWEHSSD
jgi:hypothetical protein